MEALALIGFIVQTIGAVSTAVGYINNVRDAPKERLELLREVQSLLPLLTELQARVKAAKPDDPWFASARPAARGHERTHGEAGW